MTNHCARKHWGNNNNETGKKRALEPSSWLDVAVSMDQKALLNPTTKVVIRGSILNDTMGEGAKKKIAKRRINFWDGNISSYSRVLNSSEQIANMREVNELTAVLGEIRQENEQEKETRSRARALAAQEKEQRKAAAVEAVQRRKEQLLPQLITVAEAACANVAVLETVSVGQLRDMLRYLFEPPLIGISSMKKDALLAAAKLGLEAYKANRHQV